MRRQVRRDSSQRSLDVALETDRGWFTTVVREYGGFSPGCEGKFFSSGIDHPLVSVIGSDAKLLELRTTEEVESGQDSNDGAREFAHVRYSRSQTDIVLCAAGIDGTPLCAAEIPVRRIDASVPPEPSDGEWMIDLTVTSRCEVVVTHLKERPSDNLLPAGRYSLNW